MSDHRELERIAAELYAGPPTEFTAARNARAKDVDDPALAKSIRALRRPTLAAWVVNLFARERADRLSQALQLAAELREAQEDLDAATLSQLGRQRRALTNQLAAEAASLAQAQGAQVTDATREAVRQTISAAFFDEAAASAVASGRLVRDLEPSASFDPDAAVGGGPAGALPASPPPADELGARRERRRAERALRDAQQRRERAERAFRRAEQDAEDAHDRVDDLTARAAQLEEELARVRRQAVKARENAEAAESQRAAAAEALADAEDAVATAQRDIAPSA